MTGWNFADLWEAAADVLADSPAIVQGDRSVSWTELERNANGLAGTLIDAGLTRQDKVALYLFNCPEYIEASFAAVKAGLVPVNTNFRYRAEELTYLWINADAAAVVFHASLAQHIEDIRQQLPAIRVWICVDDGPCPDWALPYERAVYTAAGRVAAPWRRSADDLMLLYTGGTTGMPKGVMWRQGDMSAFLNGFSIDRYPDNATLGEVRDVLQRKAVAVHLLPSPLMHGTAGWAFCNALMSGDTVVLLAGRRFDAVELLDTIDRERVNRIGIVGEAFARPLVDAIDAHPGRWTLRSLTRIGSSGAALSATTKRRLLAAFPAANISETLSSSEALTMGAATITEDSIPEAGQFRLPAGTRILTDDGRDVVPGSGEIGLLAVSSLVPLGYYKDPVKTAETIRVIDGTRYVVSGDYAMIDADGMVRYMGRGNATINTGGEKVYADEVEQVLRRLAAIHDVAVIGVPDDRFGEAVTALVQLKPGTGPATVDVAGQVRSHLAGYKVPRHVLFVESIARLATGKLDYPALRRQAQELLATP